MQISEIKNEIEKWGETRSAIRSKFEKIESACGTFAFTFDVTPDEDFIADVWRYLSTIEDTIGEIRDSVTDLGLIEGRIKGLAKARKRD